MISGGRRRDGMCCMFAGRRPASRSAPMPRVRISAGRWGWTGIGTTADGAVTLEPVFCLGLCASGPAALLDGQPIGRLNPAQDRSDAGDAVLTRVFVPRDAAALAVGADEVAAALAGHADVVRTGSRGMFWLEPMIEVETPEGRIAYGPVEAGDVPGLLADGLLTGAAQRLRLGMPEDDSVPGAADAADIRPLRHCRSAVAGRLPGAWRHGGAGEGPGAGAGGDDGDGPGVRLARPRRRWISRPGSSGRRRPRRRATASIIVCNADEGDSGTYADRMLLEGDPFSLIEGMAIAGFAVGATKGYVYTRSEYPHGIATFDKALAIARRARHPGRRVRYRAAGRRRRLCLRRGNLAAGKSGRPPGTGARQAAAAGAQGPVRHADGDQQPGHAGNACRSSCATGRRRIRRSGMGRSRGTMPIQLAGNIRYGGLFEAGFGVTLGELVQRHRRRHVVRPAGARGAGRRPAGGVFPAVAVRHAVRL